MDLKHSQLAVDDWIKAHQAEYDKWLADARAAAK